MVRLSFLFQFLLLVPLFLAFHSLDAQSLNNPTINVSNTWTNNPSLLPSISFLEGPKIRLILNFAVEISRGDFPCFAFGFYCEHNCTSFLLGLVVYSNYSNYQELPSDSHIIWSANRNNPVRENSAVVFTQEGNLVLADAGGTFVWSTNTSGRSVVGLEVSEHGNVFLVDKKGNIIWQSIDHPTDTLVLGQTLFEGQKLIAPASNLSEGRYFISVTDKGLSAFIDSDPPLSYYDLLINEIKISKAPSHAVFLNGSLAVYITSFPGGRPDKSILIPGLRDFAFIKLDHDGHFRVYGWTRPVFGVVIDLLKSYGGECSYPLICGEYGICSHGICDCPKTAYVRPIHGTQAELGCSAKTPLSCDTPQYHKLLTFNDLSFFHPIEYNQITDVESCKKACLSNCSCKVAFFRHAKNQRNCFLQSNIFSLINVKDADDGYKWSAHIKVQEGPHINSTEPAEFVAKANRPILVIIFAVILLLAVSYVFWRRWKLFRTAENYLHHLPEIPTRFSYKELKYATDNFSVKLGEGGFGSVYKGTLSDGTVVAVKRLDKLGHIKMSFLAEVETIGRVHHINLVRMRGFCADKAHRLLVYEYMSKGSLDKWIFGKKEGDFFDLKTRNKIILDIAKGLDYLHEECNPRILHLDIKPQNILLDEDFNAKVSNFGLSKLVEKEQSKVMTAMRGTPGYMAPEWLGCIVTEKVDVYSFGIVLLEILCGRKNFDSSKPEELMHLLSLLEEKGEEGLYGMMDNGCSDMKFHKGEVLKILKLGVWCIQRDLSRRPSMSVVVKVLDGSREIDPILDYRFLCTVPPIGLPSRTQLIPYTLSGPR